MARNLVRGLTQAGVLAGALLGFGWASPAHAVLFTYSGESNNGIGSATIDVSIVGNTLTATVNNTSPTTLIDGSGLNASALLGFGFEFEDTNPIFDASNFLSWSLTAFNINGTPATVTPTWTIISNDTNNQGIRIDLNPDNGGGVFDGLYNPALGPSFNPPGGPSDPAFYTTAVFTIIYDTNIPALASADIGSGLTGSTFVRFQNVGQGGSLKLTPTPETVPEPGILGMVGVGLLALGLLAKRRRRSQAGEQGQLWAAAVSA